MALILTAVLGWFARILLARFLLATAVFFVSNAIGQAFLDYLQTAITNQLGALPGSLSTVVFMIGIPDAISILFSGYATALTLKGLSRFAPTSGG